MNRPPNPRKLQIVEAATRLLATEGARRMTADRLAQEVGLTAGALFRHFRSMDEIFDALLERVEALLFTGFPPRADDPKSRLRLFFQHRSELIATEPAVASVLLFGHLTLRTPQHAAQVQSFRDRTQAFLRETLGALRAEGLLVGDLTLPDAAALVTGAMLALAHLGTTTERSEAQARAIRVWGGLERALFVPSQARGAEDKPPD